MNLGESQEITVLKDHFQTLRDRVSQARKQGMDTKIAGLKLMNIAPKIQMAQATNQSKDVKLVARLLADIEREMKQLKKEQRFEDVMKQVVEQERERLHKTEQEEDYVKLTQGEIINKTNKLINQATEYLNNRQFEKVYPVYREIQGIYKYLPRELKKEVYSDSIMIYNRLQESGIFKAKKSWKLFFKRLIRRFDL